MKIKSLILIALVLVTFGCSENFDAQPDASLENPASMLSDAGQNTSTLFNVATNFVLASGSNEEATMQFGLNQAQSEDVAIKAGFFIKVPGNSNFVQLFFNPYNDLIIPANQTLSSVLNVKRSDFGICASVFTLKMKVLEVRRGGVLIPAAQYNVLSFLPDGSTDLEMEGPGCSGGQVPGNNSWDPIFKEVLYNQVY